jgi:hypothetical protein
MSVLVLGWEVKPVRPQECFEPQRIRMSVGAASIFLGVPEEVRRQAESGRTSTLKLVRTPEGEAVDFDATLQFDL